MPLKGTAIKTKNVTYTVIQSPSSVGSNCNRRNISNPSKTAIPSFLNTP